jgi:hypothetical protein
LSLIAKARSGSQDLRKLGTKVLSENSVKYWTALGGLHKIRELRRETGVAATMVVTRTFSDGRTDGRTDDGRGSVCDLDAL